LVHFANTSYRVGWKITWDEAKKSFVNDSEAHKLLTRDYRKLYVVWKEKMMAHEVDRRRWIGRIAQSVAALLLSKAMDWWSSAGTIAALQRIARYPRRNIPIFYPLGGPATGLSLLAESALPCPHHRGLWLGCQPLIDGDYWGDTSLD